MHFSPCLVLRSTSIYVYMLGSMFYRIYVLSFHMFTHVLPCLCLDLCFHMIVCLDLYFYVLFTVFRAQIYIHICLYAWIQVLPHLCAKLSHVHKCVAMPMPRSMFSRACVLGSKLYTFYVVLHVLLRSMPCLRAQTQAMFLMPCAIVALLSLYLSFWYFGVMVRTQSSPYDFCHRPYTLAHIKVFGSHLFACLCLLASMLYAYASLSCSRLCHA